MARSGDVQDERYAAVPWMARSGDVQDERYAAVPCLHRDVYIRNNAGAIIEQEISSRHFLSTHIHV